MLLGICKAPILIYVKPFRSTDANCASTQFRSFFNAAVKTHKKKSNQIIYLKQKKTGIKIVIRKS